MKTLITLLFLIPLVGKAQCTQLGPNPTNPYSWGSTPEEVAQWMGKKYPAFQKEANAPLYKAGLGEGAKTVTSLLPVVYSTSTGKVTYTFKKGHLTSLLVEGNPNQFLGSNPVACAQFTQGNTWIDPRGKARIRVVKESGVVLIAKLD